MITLAEKMERWAELAAELALLESEIAGEVMALGKTQKVGAATAVYTKGRGSYDYQGMARVLDVGDELVKKHTAVKESIDWRKITEEAGADDTLKEAHYTPGKPSVRLKALS